MIDKTIQQLFKSRDIAIKNQNRELFLSTQIDEIERGSNEGYLGVEHLSTKVLAVHEENELEKVVFVKELYKPSKNIPYDSYLIYYLVNTVNGWRIYKVK